MYSFIPDREVKRIKETYAPGTRIRLIESKDPIHPIEPGMTGTVRAVDDVGTVHMHWDNGRGLGLVVGEDIFEIIKD